MQRSMVCSEAFNSKHEGFGIKGVVFFEKIYWQHFYMLSGEKQCTDPQQSSGWNVIVTNKVMVKMLIVANKKSFTVFVELTEQWPDNSVTDW